MAAVKKLSPVESLKYLYYGRQRANKVLYQAIKSAVSNAKGTLKVDENLLKFKLFTVEQGQVLRRYRPGSRGNVKPIKRKMSHIKIILSSDEAVVKKEEVRKIEAPVKKEKVEKLEIKKKPAIGKTKASAKK